MSLLETLPSGPLAIIGDVHGEFEALLSLLEKPEIGYANVVQTLRDGTDISTIPRPKHTLIFVGDLIDRGPNSPAVVSLVLDLIDAGFAQCIAGNHELNLVLGENDRHGRPGTGWFSNRTDDGFILDDAKTPFQSEYASESQQERFHQRLDRLPVLLTRSDLSVVHACWDADAIAAVQQLPPETPISEAFHHFEKRIESDPKYRDMRQLGKQEIAPYEPYLRDQSVQPPPPHLVPNYIEEQLVRQNHNPIKVLTSGRECAAQGDLVFKEKWRLLDRVLWWKEHTGPTVVMGHYWRTLEDAWSPWRGIDPRTWLDGRVFCVDYSIGRSYANRAQPQRSASPTLSLGALLWPEENHNWANNESPRLVFSDQPTVNTYGLLNG